MDQEPEFDPTDFERQLEALFNDAEASEGNVDPAEEDEPVEPDPESPDEGDGDRADPDPEDDAASGSSQPTRVNILDREFDETDARSLVEFYDWVKANPAQAIAIDTYLRGQAQFVPVGQEQQPAPVAPAEPEPDAFEDLDPALRAKLKQIDELTARVAEQDQARAREYQSEVEAAVIRGTAAAATRLGLSDEEAEELKKIGAAMNVLPGLAQQKNGDLVAAVEATMDLAYWSTPKFRDQAVLKFAEQQTTERRRQAKASSLSGGSGSVPRTPKEPSTNEGRREAMVSAIAEAMAEQTQE